MRVSSRRAALAIHSATDMPWWAAANSASATVPTSISTGTVRRVVMRLRVPLCGAAAETLRRLVEGRPRGRCPFGSQRSALPYATTLGFGALRGYPIRRWPRCTADQRHFVGRLLPRVRELRGQDAKLPVSDNGLRGVSRSVRTV